jgi:S1-C subfamily serine protease
VASLLVPALCYAQEADGYKPDTAVADAASVVRPSVVAVETRFDEPVLSTKYAFWQFFRGPRPLYGLWGSGFVYSDPEYVITASGLMDHAEFIRVILEDGRSFKAELIGENETFNVAVLKVDWGPDVMPMVPVFGDSSKLKLGQPVGLVGKPLFSNDTFSTAGVLSAIRKEMPGADEPTDEFLQFDASYQLSYVGGPIIDVYGNIVGMIDFTAGGVNLNLGVPINEVLNSAEKIILDIEEDVLFGVETQFMAQGIKEIGLAPFTFDLQGDGEAEDLDFGMWVSYITPNSPADIAGLMVGDTIVSLDNILIDSRYAWNAYVRDFRVGQLVMVKYIRKNDATGEWYLDQTQVQIVEDTSAEDEDEESGGPGGGGSSLPPGHP